MKRALVLVALSGCHCGASTLGAAQPKITVAPGALAFIVYVGASSTQSVVIANGGTAGDTVGITLSGAGVFTTSSTSIALGPGSTSVVPVVFTPPVAGTFTATLALTGSAGTLEVAITGAALAPLACTPTGPCDTAVFVADAGACEYTQLADGTSCTGDPCLVSTKCVGGACLGTPNACDDGNACTLDYCVSGSGCRHLDDSARCNGGVPCQVYGCDPSSGCTQSTAADGTLCASGASCQMAEVCVLGNCIGTMAPDGTPCTLPWDPCVDAGCMAGECHDAVAEALAPGQLIWDAGIAAQSVAGPYAIDDAGLAYFVLDAPSQGGDAGSNTPRVFQIAAIDACGRTRWTNDSAYFNAAVMVHGDEVVLTDNLGIAGLDRATGATRWFSDLALPYGPAMSNQGTIYALVFDDGGVERLAALSRDGVPLWQLTPAEKLANLVVDAAGNVYGFSAPPEVSIYAYSPTGTPLWANVWGTNNWFGAYCNYSVAVGASSLWFEGTQYTLDGGALNGTIDYSYCLTAPVLIDAAGDLYAFSGGAVEKLAFDATGDGSAVWRVPGISDGQSLTLANDGTVFAVSTWTDGGADIWWGDLAAIDGDAGVIEWETVFPSYYAAFPALLSPASQIIVDTPAGAAAFFAGRNVVPPTNVPWYAPAGTNDGRYAAAK